MSKKRKKRVPRETGPRDDEEDEWSAKPSKKKSKLDEICILHSKDVTTLGNFTSLSSCKVPATEKLDALQKIRDRRLKESADSKHRMQIVCEKIPASLANVNLETTGWHRGCYQRFTMNLDRLKAAVASTNNEASSSSSSLRSPRKRKSAEAGEKFVFPHDQCLFCEQNALKVKQEKHWPTKTFPSWKHKDSGWRQIEPKAKDMQDSGYGYLYRKVAGIDLFSAEAHFHHVCLEKFYSKHQAWSASHTHPKEHDVDASSTAHVNAYGAVKDLVQKDIITDHQVIPLTVLRQKYIEHLQKENFPNPNFRAEKLMKKMTADEEIKESISFARVESKGCVSFWLVYSSKLSTSNAVAASYLSASKDKLSEAAVYLRNVILEAFKKSKEMPWPPTAEDIQRISEEHLPDELSRFLNLVVSGVERENDQCQRTKRVVFSIGQDVCRAVSQGQWKLAKHILICTTIRHLYRSKQLTTILNRLGHCESDDFGRELETAMATALDEASTYLTPQIVKGESLCFPLFVAIYVLMFVVCIGNQVARSTFHSK